MKQQQKTLTLWIVLILLMAFAVKVIDDQQKQHTQIEFSTFKEQVKQGHVEKVVIRGKNQFSGQYKKTFNDGKTFKLTGDTGDRTQEFLETNGITPDFEEEEKQSFLSSLLLSWGPMILLIVIFYFFLRQIQAGGGKAMSFGKSKARMLTPNDKKVTFGDVSGVEEAKEELKEVVDFLKDPKKYTKLGGKIPKGVLLVGPPGTGKTLLARAVAGEANVPFFSISGSDFVEMFVGVGASRVRDLFEQGKKHAPCIIFIDEIDAVGRHRGAGLGGGHDEREQTLNQLLVEMDGFESTEGVILIAATNRIDVLDPALLRPGRFDRRVNVGRPDVRGRLGILRVHTKKTPLAENVDLEVIARGTPGFTGADLANLVNEAALLAARDNKKKLENIDFENAKDKVLMGVARRSMVISDKEKKNTAYHEAGHTLIAMSLPESDPVHKVTIIPRGGALGVTQTLPTEDVLSLGRVRINNMIAVLMGGRCAEEVIFDEMTNGASNDIERATSLARSMVCNWGMSEEMGPMSFGRHQTMGFGGHSDEGRDYSELTAQQIDKEVAKIVKGNYDLAKKMIIESKEKLIRVAEALIVWETLDAHQVRELMAGKDIGLPIIEPKNPTGGGSATPSETEETKNSEIKGFTPGSDDIVPA